MAAVNKIDNHAIAASSLSKIYPGKKKVDTKTALDSLDLTVQVGETFAFLGPNGAGKTTTIKMLLGFIKPTSGTATIFGEPIESEFARAKVGYVPEQPYFPKFLTCIELTKEHAVLSGLSYRDAKRRAIECLDIVGMSMAANKSIAKLSKGMTQRVGLACALVGNPDLLIMDEPSSGLDPLGRKELGELLQRFKSEGKTVFVSSHLLAEIEPICDRVAVLAAGKLVACATPDEIVEVRSKVAVEYASSENDDLLSAEINALGAEKIDSVAPIHTSDGFEHKAMVPANALFNFIELLHKRNAVLRTVGSQRESLQDAFMRLVDGGAR